MLPALREQVCVPPPQSAPAQGRMRSSGEREHTYCGQGRSRHRMLLDATTGGWGSLSHTGSASSSAGLIYRIYDLVAHTTGRGNKCEPARCRFPICGQSGRALTYAQTMWLKPDTSLKEEKSKRKLCLHFLCWFNALQSHDKTNVKVYLLKLENARKLV